MYYEFIQKYKRRIVLGFLVFIGLLIIWAIVSLVSQAGKVAVVVSVVPRDAQVTFNDQNKGNGTHWLPAGTYDVKVSKDGFEPVTRKVAVESGKEQNVVAVSLIPKSDEAKKWATEHESEYKNNEAYGAIEAQTNGEYFREQNPITTKLPYTDPYFTISYTTDETQQSVTLTVETPSPRYRFYAVEKIRQLGYDPTDFVIVFKDFKNPLSTAGGQQ